MIKQWRQINYRENIHLLLNQKNYKIGIEIGTFEGDFTNRILSNWGGTLYSLDVWAEIDYNEYRDDSNRKPEDTLHKVIDNVKGYENRNVLIRTTSEYGSTMFPDEYFDFVYIDANHKYEYVKKDIEYWYPKIKKGGMISGHDYIGDYDSEKTIDGKNTHVRVFDEKKKQLPIVGIFGVNPAVDEFTKEHDKKFYVTKEYFGTWYFFK